MEGIRMTATALCITAVITAVLFMLLPSEKYRGIMKFAVSLFMLCGLIAPFTGGIFSFSFVTLILKSSFNIPSTDFLWIPLKLTRYPSASFTFSVML